MQHTACSSCSRTVRLSDDGSRIVLSEETEIILQNTRRLPPQSVQLCSAVGLAFLFSHFPSSAIPWPAPFSSPSLFFLRFLFSFLTSAVFCFSAQFILFPVASCCILLHLVTSFRLFIYSPPLSCTFPSCNPLFVLCFLYLASIDDSSSGTARNSWTTRLQ